MKKIFKCNACSKYTMKEICNCGNKNLLPRPIKYSIDDRLGIYRRQAKIDEYRSRGLL